MTVRVSTAHLVGFALMAMVLGLRLGSFSFPASAQADPLPTVIKKWKDYSVNGTQEKIIVTNAGNAADYRIENGGGDSVDAIITDGSGNTVSTTIPANDTVDIGVQPGQSLKLKDSQPTSGGAAVGRYRRI